MDREYDPSAVEPKWQKAWANANAFSIDIEKAKDPYYLLVMFPYPSGARLHVGHWFQYSIPDSYGRFLKMRGKEVFHPMGFDAFGLPAENYAIKTGTPPVESTATNVLNMIEQYKRMGVMYDWDYMLNTSTPEYYQWTQWLFLQMFQNNLAYKKLGNVNWCPKDQTVLANEQVHDGCCERCGTEVIQKPLEQWYWKITDYAERLLNGLEKLDWPEKTKLMQTNWIGKSEGAEVDFEVVSQVSPRMHSEDAWVSPRINSGANHPNGTRANHPNGTRTVHLIFTPQYRNRLFEEATDATKILRILDDVASKHDIVIHESAAMPEHVHLLVSFDAKRQLELDIVKKLKGASAREYLKNMPDDMHHLWGEKKHFEEIENQKQFDATLAYIRNNPKEAGYEPEGRILSNLIQVAMPVVSPRINSGANPKVSAVMPTLNPVITVFTTRPDTLFGATYVVLAPEHPLVDTVTTSEHKKAIDAYRLQAKKKTELMRQEEKEKTGVFTGGYVTNPATKEEIPVWIADYALMNYGTGAVMGVPGHDERDWEFATKHKLPIVEVVSGGDVSAAAFTDDGTLINSDFLNGKNVHDAKKAMIHWLEKEKHGKGIINYRLRDWLVSRQRYWGAPIPIVYDPEGNPHPVPEEHLPWLLPTDVEFKPTGESPLKLSKEFIARTEKIFGKGWKPEYDTMDTFVCSSFYELRFLMSASDQEKSQKPNPKSQFVDKDLEKKMMPVDLYIGGPEHATMHLIYARFVMMALHDFGFVEHSEPFQKLVHQGLITNKGAKMSKSKGNVVDPDDYVKRYGADVFRMFLMFMGPFTDGGDWSDTGIKGIDRFVQRLYRFVSEKTLDEEETKEMTIKLHATIKRVTESVERFQFNTAISALMEFLNAAEEQGSLARDSVQTIAKLLAPIAPHLAEEIWAEVKGPASAKASAGKKEFVMQQEWPEFDPKLLVSDTMTIVIQVNGKVRADISVASDASEKEIIKAAKAEPNVAKYLETEPKKEIYVKGKLVSFVV